MTCNDLSHNCLTYSKIQANLQETGKQFTFERGLRNDTSFPPSFRAIPDDQPQDITPFIVPKGILVPSPRKRMIFNLLLNTESRKLCYSIPSRRRFVIPTINYQHTLQPRSSTSDRIPEQDYLFSKLI
jgi:hypothetical protein